MPSGTDQGLDALEMVGFRWALHMSAARILRRSPWLRSKAWSLGDVARHVQRMTVLGAQEKLFKNRSDLWDAAIQELGGDPVRGVELGVYRGGATSWWLASRANIVQWDGFDLFTGMPRAWSRTSQGDLDCGGSTPPLTDSRIRWHVGDVSSTIWGVDWARSAGQRMLVLFDLDLYEPSLEAWRCLARVVSPGDVLWFDEAYDSDEAHLVEHDVLPTGSFDVVGYTAMGLCLKVRAAPDPSSVA